MLKRKYKKKWKSAGEMELNSRWWSKAVSQQQSKCSLKREWRPVSGNGGNKYLKKQSIYYTLQWVARTPSDLANNSSQRGF